MAPSPTNAVLRALHDERAYLVDEAGTRLVGSPAELLAVATPVWAHLCDAQDGRWYVEPLRHAAELAQARYAGLLGEA